MLQLQKHYSVQYNQQPVPAHRNLKREERSLHQQMVDGTTPYFHLMTVLFILRQEERLLAGTTQLQQRVFFPSLVLNQQSVHSSPFYLFVVAHPVFGFQNVPAVILQGDPLSAHDHRPDFVFGVDDIELNLIPSLGLVRPYLQVELLQIQHLFLQGELEFIEFLFERHCNAEVRFAAVNVGVFTRYVPLFEKVESNSLTLNLIGGVDNVERIVVPSVDLRGVVVVPARISSLLDVLISKSHEGLLGHVVVEAVVDLKLLDEQIGHTLLIRLIGAAVVLHGRSILRDKFQLITPFLFTKSQVQHYPKQLKNKAINQKFQSASTVIADNNHAFKLRDYQYNNLLSVNPKCMRNSSKSFANEYGVSQKNITNNPSQGMGLNPNLNIEDEYIQNLLKQTHFLNMEIKLIKEKQKQNKGMGIMGLLNKDQNPVVTHAITSNNKYSDMKTHLSLLVNTAQVDYIKLDDENYAVKAERDFVERNSLKEEQKNIENKIYVDKVLGQYREKLSEHLKKLKDLREENRFLSDNFHRIHRDWEDLKTKTKTKNLFKEISDNLQIQVITLKQKHLATTETKLNANQAQLDEADKFFREDPNFKQLMEENTQLKQKVKRTDKELFDLNYRAKQMEELRKMSIRNKDVEAELKKQALQESERLLKKLTDKKADLDGKMKEGRNALQNNDEIRLLRGKIARRDKEINDLRKKTEVSQTNYKRLRDEVQKLQAGLADKKQQNKERQQKLNGLKVKQNEEGVTLRQCELDFQKAQSDLSSLENNLRQTKKRLEGLEEQSAYLGAKQDFLNKEIDIDEGIKNVKIEQLTSLMHSNSGLNDTIGNLMTKWDQIIKFSREPPSS